MNPLRRWWFRKALTKEGRSWFEESITIVRSNSFEEEVEYKGIFDEIPSRGWDTVADLRKAFCQWLEYEVEEMVGRCALRTSLATAKKMLHAALSEIPRRNVEIYSITHSDRTRSTGEDYYYCNKSVTDETWSVPGVSFDKTHRSLSHKS